MLAVLEVSSELRAAMIVEYSPDVEVPALTTLAPLGGEVREAANTRAGIESMKNATDKSMIDEC